LLEAPIEVGAWAEAKKSNDFPVDLINGPKGAGR
jgi:hypothetical protein